MAMTVKTDRPITFKQKTGTSSNIPTLKNQKENCFLQWVSSFPPRSQWLFDVGYFFYRKEWSELVQRSPATHQFIQIGWGFEFVGYSYWFQLSTRLKKKHASHRISSPRIWGNTIPKWRHCTNPRLRGPPEAGYTEVVGPFLSATSHIPCKGINETCPQNTLR